MTKTSGVPEGYRTVTPYLSLRGAAAALDFYRSAFGAREVMRMPGPDGTVGHAEIEIGDSRVMLADEYPDMDFLSPLARGGTTVHMHVYVVDVDAVMARAVTAGGKELRAAEDKFYGDRSGAIEDPFGHVWHISTRKEDLSEAEMRRRAEDEMRKFSDGAA